MIRRPWPMIYGAHPGLSPHRGGSGLASFRPLEPPRLGGFPPPPDWGEYQLAARINKPREFCFLAPMYRNALPPPPPPLNMTPIPQMPPHRRLVMMQDPDMPPYPYLSPQSQPSTRCSCHCLSPRVRSRSLENIHRSAIIDEIDEDEPYFLKHRKHSNKENYLKRRSMENLVEVQDMSPIPHQHIYPHRSSKRKRMIGVPENTPLIAV